MIYTNHILQDSVEEIHQFIDQKKIIILTMQKNSSRFLAIERTYKKIHSIDQARLFYIKIFANLNTDIPKKYLWISEFNTICFKKSPYLILHGFYLDNPNHVTLFDHFVHTIMYSPLFSLSIQERVGIVQQRTLPHPNFLAYPFCLKIPLDHLY